MNPRHKKILLFIFIWALASGLGLYLRLYTLRNNVPHEIAEKATIRVIKNLRLTINQQVEKANPALSPVEKQRIAKQQFDQILRDEKQNVRDAIAQASLQLTKNIPHEQNPVYLLASDSYYYYNLTQNIVDTGKTILPYIERGMFCVSLFYNPKSICEPSMWRRKKEDNIWVRFALWEGEEDRAEISTNYKSPWEEEEENVNA